MAIVFPCLAKTIEAPIPKNELQTPKMLEFAR